MNFLRRSQVRGAPEEEQVVLRWAGITLMSIALLVVSATWIQAPFIEPFLTFPRTVPTDAALLFLLLGITLWTSAVGHAEVSRLLAAGLMALAAWAGVEYLLGDGSLFGNGEVSFVQTTLAFEKSMAPNTALGFFLIGLILFIRPSSSSRQWAIAISQLAALSVAYLGLEAVAGYVSGLPFTYTWFDYPGMGLLTASLFLGVGILTIRWILRIVGERATVPLSSAKERHRIRRHILLNIVGIMTLASLLVGFTVGRGLYRAELDSETENLVAQAETLSTWASSLAAHRKGHKANHVVQSPTWLADRFAAFDEGQPKEGGIKGWLLARRGVEGIEWLTPPPKRTLGAPASPAIWPDVPMQRALAGEAGLHKGMDGAGRQMLSAYRPVAGAEQGVVVSLPLKDIQAPFVRAFLLAGVLAALVIMLSALAVFLMVTPLIRQIEGEERLREANRHLEQTQSSLRHLTQTLEQRVAERTRQIAADEARQGIINQLLRIGLEAFPLEVKLEKCMEVIASLDWPGFRGRGTLFLMDETQHALRFGAGFDLADGQLEQCGMASTADCFCGEMGENGELLSDGVHEHHCCVTEPHEHVTLPLQVGRHVVGVLNLYFDKEQKLDHAQRTFLDTLCSTLAGIIAKGQAEQALRHSEERFSLAVQGANDGLWDWDIEAGEVYFSPRCSVMQGFPESAATQPVDAWFSRIHPDDIFEYQRRLRQHLDGYSEHFRCEYRMQHRDGGYRWRLSRGLAIRDETGRPYRMAGSTTDIDAQKRLEDELTHNALHDALTGLPNRVLLMERLERLLKQHRRAPHGRGALLFLDMDRFKMINDSLGHLLGDQFLVETGRRLRELVRESDTVARLGGDEFVVLLEESGEMEDVFEIAKRIQAKLREPLLLEGHEVICDACIGISLLKEGYDHPEEVLRDADSAMYHAKAQGAGQVSLFREEMHKEVLRQFSIESQLRNAIERDEFSLFMQPIVRLDDGAIMGVESLLRWEHPTRGRVPPDEFIPVAEETGLILPIGRWVLERAMTALAQMKGAFADGVSPYVSVNLSPRQLVDPGLLDLLKDILRRPGVAPEQLKLEITEGVIMGNPERASAVLDKIKVLGVQLSMDDFGTGYSSLSYLHNFPLDVLKIDRSFVARMGEGERNERLVATILDMAENFGMEVVAEGIEEVWQYELLKDMGCGYGQGYLFAAPMPCTEMSDFLQAHSGQLGKFLRLSAVGQ